MKLTFYVITHNLTLKREDRLNKHAYIQQNWAKHCGNPVRPGDLFSYWTTGNEFYLDYEGALPVEAEFPDEPLMEMKNRNDWNLLALPKDEFEATIKSSVAFEGIIDTFVLHYVKEVETARKIREIRYNPAIFTSLATASKNYTGPVSLITTVYRTIITNEVIGKTLGRESSIKINQNGKLDYIELYAKPDYLRGKI